jgi:hypothetical protein
MFHPSMWSSSGDYMFLYVYFELQTFTKYMGYNWLCFAIYTGFINVRNKL